MKNVEIKIFPIAEPRINDAAVRAWLDHVGATAHQWPRPDDDLTSAEAVVGLAAKRCYMSFEAGLNPNVTKVRKDWTDYFNNILASGHGSVIEHASYTFAIEGCSRVFTAEMNRHRAGVAISEGSMRYIRFDDIPYWVPNSLRPSEGDLSATAHRKSETQASFRRVFEFVETEYKRLTELWDLDGSGVSFDLKKKITSCLRRIVPMGVASGGVWTMNLRAVRHIMAMRASPSAEEEMLEVFSSVGKYMCEKEPRIFGDFEQTPEGYWVPKHWKV